MAVLCCNVVVVKMPNTGNFAELHIAEHQGMYTEFWGRLIHFNELMQNVSKDSVEKMTFCAAMQQSPSTSIHRISRATGIAQTQVWQIFHHDCLNL
jgi:hypothetical protein